MRPQPSECPGQATPDTNYYYTLPVVSEMLAGVPRERSRATRAVDEWIRVERDEYWCI
jgi:hypothetical protein